MDCLNPTYSPRNLIPLVTVGHTSGASEASVSQHLATFTSFPVLNGITERVLCIAQMALRIVSICFLGLTALLRVTITEHRMEHGTPQLES